MATLQIPGVGTFDHVRTAKSVSMLLRDMRAHGAASSAGDTGSITVWRQGDMYFAEGHRYRVTRLVFKCKTQTGLRKWLETNWAFMGREDIS